MRKLLPILVVLAGWPAPAALADGGPIMPLTQVQPGMKCMGDSVIQGTAISSFNVDVIGVVQEQGQGARILVRVSGQAVEPWGIAEGFSGSPVYCPDATGTMRNIGAISEGVGEYGNDIGLVTPIEQMLGEPVTPPVGTPRLQARARPLLGPLTVAGLSPTLLRLLQQAGDRAGRVVVAAPGGSAQPEFPVQQLIPGASVAVAYSTGALSLSAIGTVTYTDGPHVYAFGHELDGAGRRSLLLQDAFVYQVINNPSPDSLQPSYKLAVPGHTVGTLTGDTPNAVIGRLGAPPGLIPVDVSAIDLDTGETLALDSQAADETGVGLPLGTSLVDMVAPLEVGQAAIQIYNGAPADESGRMCFAVYVREARLPLRFCKRYVGTGGTGDGSYLPPELASAASTDVTTALGLLDAEQFATLHVTRVTAQLDARRGLAEGTIIAAHAPLRVRAGHAVTVRVLVRSYRGPLRMVRFKLRIPRGLHGDVLATVHGAGASAPGSGQSLAAALTAALTGGGGPAAGPAPASMAALRSAFAAIGPYDGLTVSFGRGHAHERVYTDRALLISGSAALPLIVRR